MKIDVFHLKVIYTCDQCDSLFCALQLTALIKPNWRVLRHCCASLYHSLIVVQPSWTTIPCPTTKLSLLISESYVGTKQSVISLALKTPLKTRLGICIYKTLLLHRVDDHIGFTSSCPPTIYNKIAPMIVFRWVKNSDNFDCFMITKVSSTYLFHKRGRVCKVV